MVRIKQSCMVSPAEETPRGSLSLSILDIIICDPHTHIPSVLFYPHNTTITTTATNNNPFDFRTLKDGLSRALVHFYPLAGRLRRNSETGRLEIDCNGEGAFFIEADTHHSLSHFGEYYTPNAELCNVVIPKCDYSGGLSSFPLLLAQLTRFSCGGVALGLAQNHQVADGSGYNNFINSWARLARGLQIVVKPHIDRTTHLAPRCPPQVKFHHLEHAPPLPPVGLPGVMEVATVRVVKFSRQRLNELRQKVGGKQELSTFQMLGGHIWSSVCKARGLSDDQDVKLYMPTDGRQTLKLAEGYFGNAIFITACIAKAGEVAWNPFWYAATLIKEAVQRIKEEDYLRSAIDYCESKSTVVRGPSQALSPNFSLNSWAKLPSYEAHFGWGQPYYAGHGGLMYEGQCFITQAPERDGSLLASIKLCTAYMPCFEKYVSQF